MSKKIHPWDRSVEARDSGVYICVARMGALVNMARANLTVAARPQGITGPRPGADPRILYPGNSAPALDRQGNSLPKIVK